MKKRIRVLSLCAALVAAGMMLCSCARSVTFDTPEEMADYVERRLGRMVKEVNRDLKKGGAEELWEATRCDGRYTVPIWDSEEYIICLDFDGDRGYAVISHDQIMKLETVGDASYLAQYGDIAYFSVIDDDFVYIDGDDYQVFGYEEPPIE